MTCLYCGKKLGFFSRYKDTPFCSEEHLRVHQDELERALMERLGSKSAAPAKSLRDLAIQETAPIQSMVGLESSLRAEEHKPLPRKEAPPVMELHKPEPPKPVVEAPKPAPAPVPSPAPVPPPPPQATAPAPLHENYLVHLPNPKAALHTTTPLIPPSSFAIIMQADCCTPHFPDHAMDSGFVADQSEFEVEISSFAAAAPVIHLEEIQPFDEGDFGEPWVELPAISIAQPAPDFSFTGDEASLDYEAVNTSLHHTAFGHRDEIEPRIRLRYPYAASQVTSTLNSMPSFDESMVFTDATEWDPITPVLKSALAMEEPVSALVELAPAVDVPLSISALLHFTLDGADSEDFGETLDFAPKALEAGKPLSAEYATEDWGSRLCLPAPATQKSFRPRWHTPRSSDRVPPVSFPSLFQLGSVLPPRPETSAG